VNRLLSVVQGQESVAETLFDKCKGFDIFSVKTLALLIVILLCICCGAIGLKGLKFGLLPGLWNLPVQLHITNRDQVFP
jgi:hypothetical protein